MDPEELEIIDEEALEDVKIQIIEISYCRSEEVAREYYD